MIDFTKEIERIHKKLSKEEVVIGDPSFHVRPLMVAVQQTCSQHPCQISLGNTEGNLMAACHNYCHQCTVSARLKYRLFVKFYDLAAALTQLFLWQRSCNKVSICLLLRLTSIMSLWQFLLFHWEILNSADSDLNTFILELQLTLPNPRTFPQAFSTKKWLRIVVMLMSLFSFLQGL